MSPRSIQDSSNTEIKTNVLGELIPHFYPVFTTNKRYVLMKGGAGSGKSHSAAEKYVMRAGTESNQTFIALRKARPYVKLSCWPLLKHYLDKWKTFYIENKSDLTYTIPYTGSQIMCMGLDEPEKIKSVENVDGLWLEEATEFTMDDFIQLDLRMRGLTDSYYQIMLSFNPISRLTWLFKEFYQTESEDALYHESTYKDNPFLDNFYRKRLERLVHEDENYHKIYALNQWGELKATIYTKWQVKNLHLGKLHNQTYFDFLIGGLDFGFNEESAFVLIGVKDKIIYILDEIYLTGLTNTDLISKVEEKFQEYGLLYNEIEIYCDNEPDRITEFCRRGFRASPANKKKVWSQIDFIKRFQIIINTLCPNFRKEIEGYKAKEDRQTKQVLDEPVKFRDHLMDAFRYAFYTLYSILGDGHKQEMPIFGGESLTKGLIYGKR